MATLKRYFENLLAEDEIDKFADWAFGEEFSNINGSKEFAENWNKIHGKVFVINFKNKIKDDAEYMVKLWKERMNCK